MKILLIRRDNIGDLVCTTPFIHAIRNKFPDAEIHALVHSYNYPVLVGNPDINTIHTYKKTKHRSAGESLFSILFDRVKLTIDLLTQRFDYAIVATSKFEPRALRLAQLTRPKHIVGFQDQSHPRSKCIDIGTPHIVDPALHEVEDVFRLTKPMGITAIPGPTQLFPNVNLEQKIRATLPSNKKTIGIHISARKLSNRWQSSKFITFIEQLHATADVQFALYWSPGDKTSPLHPGDDQKAAEIISGLNKEVTITPIPTQQLAELIAGVNVCDVFICSDGGAMHIAAALRKPIVCFFGGSGSSHWYPWQTPHVLLEPKSLKVSDITIDEAVAAYQQLDRDNC